jgi:hypothetical protein
MLSDEQLTKDLNNFFQNIAPVCSFEEYKLTFHLFLFLDHYKRNIRNNKYALYLDELINGFQNQSDFKNIYAPIGLTVEQILKAVIQVNERRIFNIIYTKEDKLLTITFMGI